MTLGLASEGSLTLEGSLTHHVARLYPNGRADLRVVDALSTEDGRLVAADGRLVAAGSWIAIWAAARLMGGGLTMHFTGVSEGSPLRPMTAAEAMATSNDLAKELAELIRKTHEEGKAEDRGG